LRNLKISTQGDEREAKSPIKVRAGGVFGGIGGKVIKSQEKENAPRDRPIRGHYSSGVSTRNELEPLKNQKSMEGKIAVLSAATSHPNKDVKTSE